MQRTEREREKVQTMSVCANQRNILIKILVVYLQPSYTHALLVYMENAMLVHYYISCRNCDMTIKLFSARQQGVRAPPGVCDVWKWNEKYAGIAQPKSTHWKKRCVHLFRIAAHQQHTIAITNGSVGIIINDMDQVYPHLRTHSSALSAIF